MKTERRVRTERILIFGLGSLVLGLTALYFILSRSAPQFEASSLLLYSLSMVNVVLVLVLLFVPSLLSAHEDLVARFNSRTGSPVPDAG